MKSVLSHWSRPKASAMKLPGEHTYPWYAGFFVKSPKFPQNTSVCSINLSPDILFGVHMAETSIWAQIHILFLTKSSSLAPSDNASHFKEPLQVPGKRKVTTWRSVIKWAHQICPIVIATRTRASKKLHITTRELVFSLMARWMRSRTCGRC